MKLFPKVEELLEEQNFSEGDCKIIRKERNWKMHLLPLKPKLNLKNV